MTDKKSIVLVTGDVILAWDLIHRTGQGNTQTGYDPEDSFEYVFRQPAGAWYMTSLLERMISEKDKNWEIHGVGPAKEEDPAKGGGPPRYEFVSHAYAVWTEFPLSRSEPDRKTIRVKNHLGSEARRQEPPASWFKRFPGSFQDVRIVVVTDDGIEARYPAARGSVNLLDLLLDGLLGSLLEGKLRSDPPWIIWKDRQLGQRRSMIAALEGKNDGPAGDDSTEELYKRAIAIVGVDVLRCGSHPIAPGQSWETTARDVLNAVKSHSELSRFPYVIISLTNSGALLAIKDTRASTWRVVLVIDPAERDGTWTTSYEGRMVGSTTCLVATVTTSLAKHIGSAGSSGAPGLDDALVVAVHDGLQRMRLLHYTGYFDDEPDSTKTWVSPNGTHDRVNPTTRSLTESVDKIAAQLPTATMVRVEADGKEVLSGAWSIVASSPRSVEKVPRQVDSASIPRHIVLLGPRRALELVPRAAYGKLLTTDPREIDALAAIDTLLRSYAQNPGDTPLSIAVFGQPGSGKSFGVKQIVEHIGDPLSRTAKTFNLSQLSAPEMLVGALHQVRDIGLTGKIPVIFWDEFDTALGGTTLGWLRYFLAPMQDGEFQEGQVTHPIGRAIFIFAGGTCTNMAEFWPDDEEQRVKLAPYKVRDFVSRLRGFLEVPGMNAAGKEPPGLHLMIRRALILHQHLKKMENIVDGSGVRIADGVLKAFLEVREYKHGARSIEAIIRMSTLRGARRFTASCMPSRAQLDMHVSADEFLALVSGGS